MVVELLEGRVDTAAANGVRWMTRSALATALLHFSELKTEHELLGSGCNAVIPRFEKERMKPLHVCPGCSNTCLL
jgi:hypothetical protein